MPYRKCFCWLGLTRLACLQLAFFLLVLTAVKPLSVTAEEKVRKAPVRAIWFSFYDWNAMPREETAFRQEADRIMEEISGLGMNTVFLHVHSHSDAYYLKDPGFPMSKYVSGRMGLNTPYDPLAIMLEAAHSRGLKVHAWFNPFRITSADGTAKDPNAIEGVSARDIPADSLLSRLWRERREKRYILEHMGLHYLNPSKKEVRDYLVKTIEDLVRNYPVDGVHLDDYFYPALDDSDLALSFDKLDYEASGSSLSIGDWRRDNINRFMKKVYKRVHAVRPEVLVGVSPAGNLEELCSDSKHFVDIDSWLRDPGYVDYLVPQIYWGFERKNPDGSPSSEAFKSCLKAWMGLERSDRMALLVGLALYKAGLGDEDNNPVSEWLVRDDIIARQIKLVSKQKSLAGFALFDYSDLHRPEAAGELNHMKDLLK